MESGFARTLSTWRRSEGLSQAQLAARLGVSQQAVSYWERGADVPAPLKMAELRSMMAASDGITVEKAFIREQSAIRALVDTDGARVVGRSRGFETVWPAFSRLDDIPLADTLVDEMARLYHDEGLRSSILRGEIALASGVSLRQTSFTLDPVIKHRWMVRFRRFGSVLLGDLHCEPCDPDAACGVELLLRPDAIRA